MTNETHDPLDFGEDDVAPASDPAFDAWIRTVAPTLNAPGTAPRQPMWEAIERAGVTSRLAQAGRVPGVTPIRRRPWRLLSMIAAAPLLGVALDRIMLRDRSDVADPRAVAAIAPAAPEPASESHPYRMAATQTLTQAEALLTAIRVSQATGPNAVETRQLGLWGREVLRSTRLLLDSPAGEDPQFRALLGDLELVLVQVIQLSGTPLDPEERALIDRALEDSELLSRIRTAVPSGMPAVSAASDD